MSAREMIMEMNRRRGLENTEGGLGSNLPPLPKHGNSPAEIGLSKTVNKHQKTQVKLNINMKKGTPGKRGMVKSARSESVSHSNWGIKWEGGVNSGAVDASSQILESIQVRKATEEGNSTSAKVQ